MKFSDFWALNNGVVSFEKSKLTKAELVDVQNTIASLQKKGFSSSKIIDALQQKNAKLKERWKAERAFWTETKREDTGIIGELGEDIGFEDYKVILSPHACKTCRDKSDGGRKIFKDSDLNKSGYGHVPPFHPNCYCFLIPVVQ